VRGVSAQVIEPDERTGVAKLILRARVVQGAPRREARLFARPAAAQVVFFNQGEVRLDLTRQLRFGTAGQTRVDDPPKEPADGCRHLYAFLGSSLFTRLLRWR